MDKESRALELIGEQMKDATRPVVLCSFGKDSIVLLHLCLRLRKVPVLFFRFPKFHEKHAHAMKVMQQWDLEVFDMWPKTVTEYQHGDFFEVLHGYSTGPGGVLHLFSGIRERRDGETRFLCAADDLMCRPRSHGNDYPWDLTLHGHKGTDDPEIGSMGSIVHPVSKVGSTRLVVPFIDWTDDDIWSYIRKYDLPYDRARYDEKVEAVSPDKYPTCFKCLDNRNGTVVDCPKYEQPMVNMSRPPEDHAAFRHALISTLDYCEVSGEPRNTENTAHL